jgi:hypothetical protein
VPVDDIDEVVVKLCLGGIDSLLGYGFRHEKKLPQKKEGMTLRYPLYGQ